MIEYKEKFDERPLIGGLVGGLLLLAILIAITIYKIRKGSSSKGRVFDADGKREEIDL